MAVYLACTGRDFNFAIECADSVDGVHNWSEQRNAGATRGWVVNVVDYLHVLVIPPDRHVSGYTHRKSQTPVLTDGLASEVNYSAAILPNRVYLSKSLDANISSTTPWLHLHLYTLKNTNPSRGKKKKKLEPKLQ